jgi:L-ascorbate metabolism protein UlaG (beta-lactamase superfamily)
LPAPTLTYIGGPTALLNVDGLRLLTDPTFDPGGTHHPAASGAYVLVKTMSPALDPAALGPLDAVLLSHDHHADNLDARGRALLQDVPHVFTTKDGAERLGSGATGLRPWECRTLRGATGDVRVTATPARHGPEGGDRGPVIGFVVESFGDHPVTIYATGDTVWYPGVADVAKQFHVDAVLAFVGAARVAVAGPHPLTLTAEEAVLVANAFPRAYVVPLHFEGWAHFSEGRAEVEAAFRAGGMTERLRWPVPGRPIQLVDETPAAR